MWNLLSKKIKKWLGLELVFPWLMLGYDIRRWESLSTELYNPSWAKKFLFYKTNVKLGGQKVGPSDIQYHSPYGFLITWPLCFYFWYQIRGQIRSLELSVPGSEIVIFFRVGLARWDVNLNNYVIPTLYFGLHWD